METIPDITVPALEIASVRYLKFKIPERRGGRRIHQQFSSDRNLRKMNQIFGEAVSEKLLIFFSNRRILALGASEEKAIRITAQFIELIAFHVIKIGLLQIFQNAVSGQADEFILP
jgi:hypothetical protein